MTCKSRTQGLQAWICQDLPIAARWSFARDSTAVRVVHMYPLNSNETRILTIVRPRCSLSPHHPVNVPHGGGPPLLLPVLSCIPLINHLFNGILHHYSITTGCPA